ncbi:MAG: SCO family protein [Verrucomicrobia bacterium]|nr:SCO family protein [Verrucomicrobiota bacterium]
MSKICIAARVVYQSGMKFFRAMLFGVALAGCGCWVSCKQLAREGGSAAAPAAPAVRTFPVRGTIQELKPDGTTAVIKHEEIPGFMAAMTMPLEVKDPKELAGLQPGDEISFRLVVTETESWIEGVTKLASAKPGGPKPTPHTRLVREVDPLNVGDLMPDYRFTNELGQAMSLSQLKGQAYALTFVFTRCPLPDFCPRMSSNFTEAAKKLRARPDAPKNWRLLTISFDVDWDTPARLWEYARRYQYDPAHWSFLTGAIIDIDAITEQFGLMFARDESGVNFSHTLRTAVIDARGRVQRIFIGNEWKSEELVEELVKAAGGSE